MKSWLLRLPKECNVRLMDFHIKIWEGNEYVYVRPLEWGCGIVSEARQATLDLEILIAASDCCSEVHGSKLAIKMRNSWPVHSDRFVDFWIEETFLWILVAFVHGLYHCNLELWAVLALEVRAGNLGQSAIAWSSLSVAMVSISIYEVDRESVIPNFSMKVHESSFERPSVYQ